jgi:PBP1b-binding outer membrane lipoprotein LpoB
MRQNRYTKTGLALAIVSLVLAGCSSADAEKGKVEKQKVEKVEKVEKQKVEKRGLSDPQKEGASDFQSTSLRL